MPVFFANGLLQERLSGFLNQIWVVTQSLFNLYFIFFQCRLPPKLHNSCVIYISLTGIHSLQRVEATIYNLKMCSTKSIYLRIFSKICLTEIFSNIHLQMYELIGVMCAITFVSLISCFNYVHTGCFLSKIEIWIYIKWPYEVSCLFQFILKYIFITKVYGPIILWHIKSPIIFFRFEWTSTEWLWGLVVKFFFISQDCLHFQKSQSTSIFHSISQTSFFFYLANNFVYFWTFYFTLQIHQ